MIHRELLPRALSYNLLATRVGAILETFGPIGLTDRDSKILEEAKSFLESALEGRRATQAMEVTEKALAASDAYGEAIEATAQLLNQGAQVPKEVEGLFRAFIEALDHLLARQPVPKERLGLLRQFFAGLREATLLQVSPNIEEITLSEG